MRDTILNGDVRNEIQRLPDQSVDCVVTSPPYWNLRDYDHVSQLGLEETPEEYVKNMVGVFREIKRVLKDNGTLWLNIADTYYGGRNNAGSTKELSETQASSEGSTGQVGRSWPRHSFLKNKDMCGLPWRLAFALQEDGWYLRQDIIWAKSAPMPESVKDRCTKSHEYIFLLSKSPKYYFDFKSIQEPAKYFEEKKWATEESGINSADRYSGEGSSNRVFGDEDEDGILRRNKRDVWTARKGQYKGAHFATFSMELIEPCILAGCPIGGIVLDPFLGSGTTAACARRLGRYFVGVELNPDYVKLAEERIANTLTMP